MKNASTKALEHEEPEETFGGGRRVVRKNKGKERYTLALVRKGIGLTQVEVAERLGVEQSEVSRYERRQDLLLSTLRRYAEALGGTCEVAIVFPKTGHRMVLAEPEAEPTPK